MGNSQTNDQFFEHGVVFIQDATQKAITNPRYSVESVPLSCPEPITGELTYESMLATPLHFGTLPNATLHEHQDLSGTFLGFSDAPLNSTTVPSSKPSKSTDDIEWNRRTTAKPESIPTQERTKKRPSKGRHGVLPADKARKAKEMRDVGACLPCWLLKVPCSTGKVCDKCRNSKSFSIGSPICTRKHLEDYTGLFFPDVSNSKFDISAAKELASQLSQGFTANKLEISLTCGRGYPGLALQLAEFVPIFEKLAPVPFLHVGDAPAYFVQRYPAPVALRDFNVDQMLDICRRHAADMVKYDSNVVVSPLPTDSLAEQIHGTINDYYKTLTIWPNSDTTNPSSTRPKCYSLHIILIQEQSPIMVILHLPSSMPAGVHQYGPGIAARSHIS
ncbi:hypothetical protein BGZ60DRAFT_159513 [Tricladium varicosporioides]|nr:hypothetical protein BGZ60DRAFT_159513 [Hymenoscyphus varicosporioides]